MFGTEIVEICKSGGFSFLSKAAHDLTMGERKDLPKSDFAVSAKKSNTGKPAYPMPDRCLSGETGISCLDGVERPIKDLVGQDVWVYAFDPNRMAVVPALATNVRLTERNAEVLQVLLDNNEEVICTPNHPFLMRDGTYRRADQLQTGDSLMPLYRKRVQQQQFRESGGKKFYEQTYQPWYRFWDWTHHLVNREISGKPVDHGSIVHHRDENSLNNSPNNLEEMTKSAHSRHHRAAGTWRPKDPSKNSARRWSRPGEREKQAERTSAMNVRRLIDDSLSEISEKISSSKVVYWEQWRKRLGDVQPLYKRYLAGESARDLALELGLRSPDTVRNFFKREGLPLLREIRAKNNHKVSSIRPFGREDVYDLTVEGPHNFALTSGVFVHNSHAESALGLSKMHGDQADITRVRNEVKEKYPELLHKAASATLPQVLVALSKTAGLAEGLGKAIASRPGLARVGQHLMANDHAYDLAGLGVLAAPAAETLHHEMGKAPGMGDKREMAHAGLELGGLATLGAPVAMHLLHK